VWKAKIQISQDTAYGNIRQTKIDTHTETLSSKVGFHGFDRSMNFVVLTLNPFWTLLGCGALLFFNDDNRSVEGAIR
jgi:hypothetical protein